MNIGLKIKQTLLSQGHSVKWLSEQIPCERTNAYKILKRETIDMLLLQRIARILHYDFFDDLSQETFHRKR